jgi:purine-binding chemotaxis protein CheW
MNLMIIESGMQRYALPTGNILEVVEPQTVSPLPHMPGYVEGLVRVMGQVMMQIDLAGRVGGHNGTRGAGTLVILRDERGMDYALRVDRVLSNGHVDEAGISFFLAGGEQADVAGDPQTAASGMIAGEFEADGHTVLMLDTNSLPPEGIVMQETLLQTAAQTQSAQADSAGFVLMESGGECYALRLGEIAEVLEVTEPVKLPHAPPEVAGVITLRKSVLLVLGLSTLLGRYADVKVGSAIVVIHHGGQRFGLIVDKMLGIRNYTQNDLHLIESFGAVLAGYIADTSVGAEGHLTGIISLKGLLPEARLEEYRKFTLAQTSDVSPVEEHDARGRTISMLTFSVGNEDCALPLEWVERIEQAGEITAAAGQNTAGAALVLGEVMPVVDLADAFCITQVETAGVWLVVRQDGQAWALAVKQVGRVVEMPCAAIEDVKRVATDYVEKIGRVGEKLFSILTLEPLRTAGACLT